MRVKRNFEEIYSTEEDPWAIGNADSPRYNLYFEKILQYAAKRSSILDIGCGFGSFLSRFRETFSCSFGIEISHLAIEKGKQKYPHITFLQDSAAQLKDHQGTYDVIVSSDVICYLKEKNKIALLDWIERHLTADGFAFIAAWAPGGNYLTHGEFKRLVRRHFRIIEEQRLESGHSIFCARKKKELIAITIDAETWHPIPSGKTIDWDLDIFQPFSRFLKLGSDLAIPLTFMVEMGEYFWLLENQPSLAEKMAAQWQQAIRQGHDVQLHLHPCWLPELGAHQLPDGTWWWDWSKKKAHDYPGDLTQLIRRCKETLENLLKPIRADYRVTSFRAGTYQAQPFHRLFDALIANGIECDSSVFQFGVSEERGYDYSKAVSNHLPYWARRTDPQLKAIFYEGDLIEIPIFTPKPAERWCLDGSEGANIEKHFNKRLKKRLFSNEFRRFSQTWLGKKLIPDSFLKEETFSGHDYFVMIGHTKGEHLFDEIAENLKRLKQKKEVQFCSLSQMVQEAKSDLCRNSLKPQIQAANPLDRAIEAMEWVYKQLEPAPGIESLDPREILQQGRALCMGYAIVLGKLLEEEGFQVEWLTLCAKNHPKGRGDDKIDSHEILSVEIQGKKHLFDPTTNTHFPHSLEELLQDSTLARPKQNPDSRYQDREYWMYDTAFWYTRVFKYAFRKDLKDHLHFVHFVSSISSSF